MKRIFEFFNTLMSYVSALGLLGFIISVMIQVVSRTFLPSAPSWTEEAARYLFIYMVAFGASVAVHKREFVGVELLQDAFHSSKVKMFFLLCIDILLLFFSVFVLKNSVLKFAILKYRMVSTAMEIPMQYVYFSLIILFTLLIISYILEIIDILIFHGKDIEKAEVIE